MKEHEISCQNMVSGAVCIFACCHHGKDVEGRLSIYISVQAEIFLFSDPTFLDGFDLKFHMPGHFPPWDVVFTCHPGHFAILHKNRTKLQ